MKKFFIGISVILSLFIVVLGGTKKETKISDVLQTALVADLGDKIQEKNIPENLFEVVRVVDGDTLVVRIDEKEEKIRLIGVDTPESVDPRKKVECFGKEATKFTTDMLFGKYVRLEGDPSQGDKDKYGRLLRYVFLPNGEFLNEILIKNGYAHEYTYRLPYRFQTEFKNAEGIARQEKNGLWATSACL